MFSSDGRIYCHLSVVPHLDKLLRKPYNTSVWNWPGFLLKAPVKVSLFSRKPVYEVWSFVLGLGTSVKVGSSKIRGRPVVYLFPLFAHV